MQVRFYHGTGISLNLHYFLFLRLMNKLKPGSVPKIHTQGGSIKLRENIGLFQNAARAYGVGDSETFQAVDCFDKQNIQQVTVSFLSFSILRIIR